MCRGFKGQVRSANSVAVASRRAGQTTRDLVEAIKESIPLSVGTSSDVFAPVRGALKIGALGIAGAFEFADPAL